MSRPALRYRLWTSGGPLVAIALTVLHLLVVIGSHAAWRGDALWAVQQLGSSLALGLPVFLALAALPPVLRGGARADANLALHPTPRSRLRRAAVDAGPALAVHLAFVAGVLLYTGGHGSVLDWRPLGLTIAVQLLSIAVVCTIGRALGEVGLHVVTVAAAALLGVVFSGFASDVFRVTAGDSSYAGLTLVEDGYVAAVLVLSAALVAAVVRHRFRWGSGMVVAVAVLAVLVTSRILDAPSLVPSGARANNCEPVAELPVCVFPGYEFMREPLASDARAVLEALSSHRVDPLIERIEQSTPGHVEERGIVSVPFDRESLVEGDLRPWVVTSVVLHPVWCPRVNSPEPLPRRFEDGQRWAYYWLVHAMAGIDDDDYARQVPAFARQSEPEQVAFVQGFLERNASCEGLT